MNYGFRKVLVPCYLLIHSLILSPSLSSKSLRGRSPKQGLINFPSISAAKLPLFPHIAYRQILTFYLTPKKQTKTA